MDVSRESLIFGPINWSTEPVRPMHTEERRPVLLQYVLSVCAPITSSWPASGTIPIHILQYVLSVCAPITSQVCKALSGSPQEGPGFALQAHLSIKPLVSGQYSMSLSRYERGTTLFSP